RSACTDSYSDAREITMAGAVLRNDQAAGAAAATGEELTRYETEIVAGATIADLPRVAVRNSRQSVPGGPGLALCGSVSMSGQLVCRRLAEMSTSDLADFGNGSPADQIRG